ncbi:lanthionine synthetase LanC family protein [Pseudonocardia sp.]|uniref:lanthionine synthetase LanC family protein n=1 Tax=Pseudonocardia sp. TaxID=60912 RepID=UPI003D0B7EBC
MPVTRTALVTAMAGVVMSLLGACQSADPVPFGLTGAGAALVRAAEPVATGGSAWRSAIQSPHRQTDRDVGAAGIANGLLALSDVTTDPGERASYLDAARQAADFLVAGQEREPGRWPDYRDPGDTAPMAYTSFDDGAAGIADLLWTMWERTGDRRYRDAALAGIDWVVGRAVGVDGADCPEMCRWAWSDLGSPSFRHGMGEGQAGIVYALSVFAERTGDPRYAEYARGGAAYLESVLDDDGGMPESADEDQRNTGYLSGAAGAAFVFLRLYVSTGDAHWLEVARRPLAFLDETATADGDGLAWPIMVDVDGEETNPHRATGMEEGAAGIGWVYLQAYAITGESHFLDQALAAGQWLTEVALQEGDGLAWAEYVGSERVHSGLNSGVAGTGWFLHDLGLASGQKSFGDAATKARHWLVATAVTEGGGWSWHGTRVGEGWTLPGEPSWHWGSAGVLAFFARLNGWATDSPGMQPALVPPRPPAQ